MERRGGENRFPGWGPAHGHHHGHSGGQEARPVRHQVTDSRPPPNTPAPPGYPLASSPFPLGLDFCCSQSPSPPNSEVLVFLPGAGAQILYQKAERLKPRGLQAQKEISCDAIAEHRAQRPGSGERRWLGSPICFLCLCHSAYGILVPRPWIKLLTPALEAQSPNHQTTREVPGVPTYITDEVWATMPPSPLPRWKSSAGHLGQADFSSRQSGEGHPDQRHLPLPRWTGTWSNESPRICPEGGRLTTYLGPEHLGLRC